MAMPGNTFSAEPVASDFEEPDDRARSNLLVDAELGGVAIGDASQGLMVQVWEARYEAPWIQVSIEGADDWTNVVESTGVTELALAFDQNMRPTVAFMAGGVGKLWWYDGSVPGYVLSELAGVRSPVVSLDDKRASQTGRSDVLLFYLVGGRIKHRLQRDRYLVEYDVGEVTDITARIRRWGFTKGKRFQLDIR